jgi:hypothetical protein
VWAGQTCCGGESGKSEWRECAQRTIKRGLVLRRGEGSRQRREIGRHGARVRAARPQRDQDCPFPPLPASLGTASQATSVTATSSRPCAQHIEALLEPVACSRRGSGTSGPGALAHDWRHVQDARSVLVLSPAAVPTPPTSTSTEKRAAAGLHLPRGCQRPLPLTSIDLHTLTSFAPRLKPSLRLKHLPHTAQTIAHRSAISQHSHARTVWRAS